MSAVYSPRVLVIRGGAIGDFILTLPALRLIRENLPACHVEVLGYPGIMDLALKAGLAHSVRSLEHRSMALLFAKGASLDPALVSYLQSFNMVISYLFDPDGILRGQMVSAGVKTYIECPHQVQPGRGHAAEQLARPLEQLALFLEEPDWRRPFFEAESSLSDQKFIALHLGSGSVKKNWPVEKWREVAEIIGQRHPDKKLALITGEAELERGITSEGFPAAAERWHGLPLTDLATRLASSCTLFLGHDSGISHLAAACGVPTRLLFGPTSPEIWAPPQTNVQVLKAEAGDWQNLEAAQVTEFVLQ